MPSPRYMVSTPGEYSGVIQVEDLHSDLRFVVSYPADHDQVGVRAALEELLNKCPRDRAKRRT